MSLSSSAPPDSTNQPAPSGHSKILFLGIALLPWKYIRGHSRAHQRHTQRQCLFIKGELWVMMAVVLLHRRIPRADEEIHPRNSSHKRAHIFRAHRPHALIELRLARYLLEYIAQT